MAKTQDDIVTFLNAAGEEISNDPRWHARRTLEAAGMQTPAVSSALVDENAALKAKIAELEAAAAQKSQGVEDDDPADEDDDAETQDEYSKMNGKELKAFAKEHDIDIKGLKTVGEVRAKFRSISAE